LVATYSVSRLTGAGPTVTTVTNVRLRSDDANTADLTNPVLIDSVLRRSYWASVALSFTGTYSQISNIRHYSSGSIAWTWGTNGKLIRGNRDSGDIGCPTGSYQQATGTGGVSGDDLVVSHSYFSGQTTKSVTVNTDTSGSPATIDTTAYTTDNKTKHIVLQVYVDTDGTNGVQTAATLSFIVDEI
jgi:hypothetical protein